MSSAELSTSELHSAPAIVAVETVPMETPKPVAQFKLGHRPELTGLRGVAVLLVMLFHSRPQILRGGYLGVDIFFVLSGFLITVLLLQEYQKNSRIDFKRFYMRRVLRLLPALLFLLVCYVIFAQYYLPRAHTHVSAATYAGLYVMNWVRAFKMGPTGHIGHTWSLSIEEQFYIVWPALLLVLLKVCKTKTQLFVAVCSGVILSLAYRYGLSLMGARSHRLYNDLGTRADALLMGCALAVAAVSGFLQDREWIKKFSKFTLLAVIAGIAALAVYSGYSTRAMLSFGYTGIALLTAMLILALIVNPTGIFATILRFAPLVWLGEISYGLYLWHYPIYRLAKHWTTGYPSVWLGMAMTLAIAIFSYFVIERPALRLKARFASH